MTTPPFVANGSLPGTPERLGKYRKTIAFFLWVLALPAFPFPDYLAWMVSDQPCSPCRYYRPSARATISLLGLKVTTFRFVTLHGFCPSSEKQTKPAKTTSFPPPDYTKLNQIRRLGILCKPRDVKKNRDFYTHNTNSA
jgi:hypothetical protein